jgi:hypothetical protein
VYPDQTVNAGKYLTTNGTTTSWGSVGGGAPDYLLQLNGVI